MILVCDIGNTNITAGLFRGERLVYKTKFPTSKVGNGSKPFPMRIVFSQIEAIVICSVVPRALTSLKASFKSLKNIPVYCLGGNLTAPIKNLYARPKQVGQDRLVNAYAASRLYGAPLVVIDFGTAVTLDVISKNREYLGGMILPGLELSLDALSARAALLPRVKLERPKEFIGRDTKSSMLSGVVYGFAALTDSLSQRIKKEIGDSAKVIGTGGNISLIAKYCQNLDKIDPDLTLKGLNLIFRHYEEKKTKVKLSLADNGKIG